jgi:hypothetical protein
MLHVSGAGFFLHCSSTQFLLQPYQFTRDALITISGAKEKGREFVYFTDVKNIPSTDLATIERLWNKFSGGKFGYSVQKVCGAGRDVNLHGAQVPISSGLLEYDMSAENSSFCFRRCISIPQKKWKQSKGDFETFCRKIGWTTTDGEVERKKRWFGASEFIYDVKKAPEGHLPLTSALRGTSLIKKLLDHPVWENEDWKKEPEN